MTSADFATADEMIRARLGDPATGVLFEEERHSWDDHARASAARAALALDRRAPGPFHIGYLLENVPELSFWLGAGAVSGATMVGINPTRQGAELAADIRHTDCQLIVTESRLAPLLAGLDIGMDRHRVLVVDTPIYAEQLLPFRSAGFPDGAVSPATTALLIFTSGTTGAPKAAKVSQGRLARYGRTLSARQDLSADSVCYEAMPLFHSNALYAGWAPTVYVGATLALRRRFSASGFLDDVKRFRATYFNYVGKPLSYIVATPPRDDDRDHCLTSVTGNEGSELDIRRFSERFGVEVTDNYGSTEGGLAIMREPGQPAGALGRMPDDVVVIDQATGQPCPPAEFDASRRLSNADACIGEIVNRGAGSFEGYYRNDEAQQRRVRDGSYWTGDLGYRDDDGWLYFAGRDDDWLRVDGENFAAAPVERIMARYPGAVLVAVYAVPAADVGDDVMVAMQLEGPAAFDPVAFDRFLQEQPDLGTKWSPRYVRVVTELPMTQTTKVLKRQLRAQRWECTGPVWWRPMRGDALRPLRAGDIDDIRRHFEARGRSAQLDLV